MRRRSSPWSTEKPPGRPAPATPPHDSPLLVQRVVRTTHTGSCRNGCWLEAGVAGDRIVFLRPAKAGQNSPARTGVCLEAWAQAAERPEERILRPYIRRPLLEAWRRARRRFADPVLAWEALLDDPAVPLKWQRARGFGGFVPADWEEVEELLAAALTSQVRNGEGAGIVGYGGDPSGGLVAEAAGARFIRLLGGTLLTPTTWETSVPPAQLECLLDAPIRTRSIVTDRPGAVILVGDVEAGNDPALRRCVLQALDRGAPVWVLSDLAGPLARLATRHVPLPPEEQGRWWLAVAFELATRLEKAPPDHPVWRRIRTTTDLLAAADGAESRRHQATPEPEAARADTPVRDGGEPTGEPSSETPPSFHPGPVPASERQGEPLLTWWDLIAGHLGLRSHPESSRAAPASQRRAEREGEGPGSQIRLFSELLWRLAEADEPWLLVASPRAIQGSNSDIGWAALATCLAVAAPRRDGRGGLYLAGFGSYEAMPASWHRLALAADHGRADPPVDATQWFWERLQETATSAGKEITREAGRPRILLAWRSDPFFINHLERERLVGLLVNPEWHNSRTSSPTFQLIADVCERLDGTAAFSDVLLPAAGAFERSDIVADAAHGRLLAAVPVRPPRGASRDEWTIFARLSRRIAALAVQNSSATRDSFPTEGHTLPPSPRGVARVHSRPFQPDPTRLGEQFSTLLGPPEGFPGSSTADRPSTPRFPLTHAEEVARRLLELWEMEAQSSAPARKASARTESLSWEALRDAPVPWPATPGKYPRTSPGGGLSTSPAPAQEGGSSGAAVLYQVGPFWRRVVSVSPRVKTFDAETASPGNSLRLRLVAPLGWDERAAVYGPVRELLGPLEPVSLHPSDAENLALATGDLVSLETSRTSCIAVCRVDPATPPGTALFRLRYPWLRVDPDSLDLGGFQSIEDSSSSDPASHGAGQEEPEHFRGTTLVRERTVVQVAKVGRLGPLASPATCSILPGVPATTEEGGGNEG